MSIDFDPRAKSVTTPSPLDETAANQEAPPSFDSYDPYLNPPAVVSEMELLFSGTRNLKQLQGEHPTDPLNIPGLESDILGPMPILGSSSKDLGEIIRRYQGLKRNLIERRNNYAHALEGFLRPAEAMDLHQRLEEIDHGLIQVEQELARAINRKHQLEEVERREVERRREAEEAAEQAAIAENEADGN